MRFADLEAPINHMVVWIQANVSESTEPETLAYMGANDIRYAAFVFACMRLRHTVCIWDVQHVQNAYLTSSWEVVDRTSTSPPPANKDPIGDAEDRVAVYTHSSGTTDQLKQINISSTHL